jgi:DNA-binding MarR family transcriptional regulator
MRTTLTAPVLTLDNLGFLLAKASQRFNERLVERLTEEGFPQVRPSYGSVLMPLFEREGLRVGEVGSLARLSKQSMTRLVAQCEADDLVRRVRDAEDGRAFRLELTPRGRRLRTVAQRALGELDNEIVARLGHEQHDALKRALNGVMNL